jgi:hypothetical protein
MSKQLNDYLELNNTYSFESDSGVRRFKKLIQEVCGYGSLEEFLADNPGAINSLVEFIDEWVPRNDEWQNNITNLTTFEE